MQLQNGRPTDTTGRLDKEIRTYDFLDKLGIEYQRIDHEAAFTMEVCEEIDKTLGATICKKPGRRNPWKPGGMRKSSNLPTKSKKSTRR